MWRCMAYLKRNGNESWIRPRKLKPKTKKKPGPRKKKPAAKAKKKRGRPKQSSWEEGSDYASDDSFVVRSCSDDELEVQSGSEEEESCGDWSDTDESSSSESEDSEDDSDGEGAQPTRKKKRERGGSEQAKSMKNKKAQYVGSSTKKWTRCSRLFVALSAPTVLPCRL